MVSNNNLSSPPDPMPARYFHQKQTFHLFSKNQSPSPSCQRCHQCPSQRQLTHSHLLPPYPSTTLLSSAFTKPLESTLFCLHCSHLVTCSWTPAINTFSPVFLPLPLSFPAPLQELPPGQSFPSTTGGFKTIPIRSSKDFFFFLKQWKHSCNKCLTTWERATHMYPDAYEIAPQSLWYLTATSQAQLERCRSSLPHPYSGSSL